MSAPTILIFIGAISSSWTGIKFLGVNVSDVMLLLAVFLRVISTLVTSNSGKKEKANKQIFFSWIVFPFLFGVVLVCLQSLIFDLSLRTSTTESLNYQTNSLTLGQEGLLLFFLRIVLATTLVAIALVSEGLIHGRRNIIRVVMFLVAGNAISCMVAVLDSSGLTNFREFLLNVPGERAVGLAFHPNSLAQSVTVLIPLTIWWICISRCVFNRICLLVVMLVQVYALYVSDSRGGIIVGFISLIISVYFLTKNTSFRKWLLPAFLTLSVLFVNFGYSIISGTRLAGTGTTNDLSTQQRMEFLEKGIEQLLDNPLFGAGLGNGYGVMVPLLVLSSGGIFFFVIYYSFILYPIRSLWIARRDPLVMATLLSLFSFLLIGMFNNSIAERFNFWPLIIGFILAMLNRKANDKQGNRRTSIYTDGLN